MESCAQPAPEGTLVPSLSKNALKRLRRDEHWDKVKVLKRAAYKERRKKRKKEQREAEGDGKKEQLEEMTEEQRAELRSQRAGLKEARLKEFTDKANANFSIIIDCLWDDLHTDKATKSLAQQILQCYGANKRAQAPVHMHLTGVSESNLHPRLKKTNIDSWIATHVIAQDYIDMTSKFQVNTVDAEDQKEGKKQLVYLSSDAEEVLHELDPNCAYIIGGIVDRNKHKGVAHRKAIAQGIRTVKLPIKEHMALSLTHVLTVNHCFELLVECGHLKSWPAALEKVIPQRKRAINDEGEEEEEEEEEEEREGKT
jgi:tRNA (guanine9-N1)-methyltransferase